VTASEDPCKFNDEFKPLVFRNGSIAVFPTTTYNLRKMAIQEVSMPESETRWIDYYPSGWREEFHASSFVEWIYEADNEITVRLEEGDPGLFYITPITGVNETGEEYHTKVYQTTDEESAYEIAATLIYAMNGTAGRVSGKPEFNG
jgi:hypothetical protein